MSGWARNCFCITLTDVFGSPALSCQSTLSVGPLGSDLERSSSARVDPSRTAAPYVARSPVIGRFAAMLTEPSRVRGEQPASQIAAARVVLKIAAARVVLKIAAFKVLVIVLSPSAERVWISPEDR